MILAHWPIVLSPPGLRRRDGLRRAIGPRQHVVLSRPLAGLDRPTERTVETLRRYDLESRYRRDAAGVIGSLEAEARRGARRASWSTRLSEPLVARGEATRPPPPRRGARPLRRQPWRMPTNTSSLPSWPTAASPPTRGSSSRGASTTAGSTTDPRGRWRTQIWPARARRAVHLQGPRPRAGLPSLPSTRPGRRGSPRTSTSSSSAPTTRSAACLRRRISTASACP